MKKYIFAGLLLGALGATLYAQPASHSVAVLAYSADQLAAQFAGNSRREVVAAINTVPAMEQVFTAQDGREYLLIRYGGAHQYYRQFLFEFSYPQMLLAVADSPQGVRAFNEKYGLNIPVTDQSYARGNPGVFLTTIMDVANGTEYQVYQNNGTFELFQNGQLARIFQDSQEYQSFLATITASNSAYVAQQAQEQTALEQAQQNQPTYVRTSYVGPILGTALVGGLVWGSINWHRHHHHHHRPGPPPPPPHSHHHHHRR